MPQPPIKLNKKDLAGIQKAIKMLERLRESKAVDKHFHHGIELAITHLELTMSVYCHQIH